VFACINSSPIVSRNHRQYQSTSYNKPYSGEPYYNQLQQPNAYQHEYQADLCAGQDKFFNPPSVYNMGQNILNGLMGSNSPGGAGYGSVTVNTHFQNFGNFNGNFNSGQITGNRDGGRGGIGSPTYNTQFQNFGSFSGNVNTGLMNGGNQRINYNNGGQNNGFDIQALLSALMRVFEKKSFGGQEQYINKQTGRIADCNQMKNFLQNEISKINSQDYTLYSPVDYNNNYNYYG